MSSTVETICNHSFLGYIPSQNINNSAVKSFKTNSKGKLKLKMLRNSIEN